MCSPEVISAYLRCASSTLEPMDFHLFHSIRVKLSMYYLGIMCNAPPMKISLVYETIHRRPFNRSTRSEPSEALGR